MGLRLLNKFCIIFPMPARIVWSRHAKRRMNLYKLDHIAIEKAISSYVSIGKQEILINEKKGKYPIKVVVDITSEGITVITAFPLKKGLR